MHICPDVPLLLYWMTRVLRDLNKDLVLLAEDEEAFKGAAPLLFGETFERRMKDHLESLKCLRRSMAPKPGTDQFFYPARGAATSEVEAGVRGTTPISKEAEIDTFRRRTIPARNSENRICNCKCVHVPTISPCNARDTYPSTIVNQLKCMGIEPIQ